MVGFRATQRWAPRERAMVAEWATKSYPSSRIFLQPRLGSPPADQVELLGADAADRLFRPTYKWADAIVVLQDRVLIAEAKLRGTTVAVDQLAYYSFLFGRTIRFREWWTLPRDLVVVVAAPDVDLRDYAALKGVRVEVFKPAWLDEYLTFLSVRTDKEVLLRRDAIRRAEGEVTQR